MTTETLYRDPYNRKGGTRRVKLTSTRTGKVIWLRPDGGITEYIGEAGLFTDENVQLAAVDVGKTMVRWNVEIVERDGFSLRTPLAV